MAYDVQESAIEPLVDGMIDLLKVNLVANTRLVADAHAGDTVLRVDNALRFRNFDVILLMDNNSTQGQFGTLEGVEFHTVASDIYDTNIVALREPLKKDFLVSDYGRIQKTIKHVPLYERDVMYGDRQVINCDNVAVCVEPESRSQEWLAVRLLGIDFRLAIMVYVKCAGTGPDEEGVAMRVSNAYADAINKILMGNIHLDFSFDAVPLVMDAVEGDTGVWIKCSDAWAFAPGVMECHDAEVQDNFGACQLLKIVDASNSSSSVSSESSSSLLLESSLSSSSPTSISSLESTRTSDSSASTSSWSSQSVTSIMTTSEPSESSSSSSGSSQSSFHGDACWVNFDRPLTGSFLVKDKAMLRKKKRYTYDSRVESIEYGSTQKGSVLMKVAKISWYGKESEGYNFPQVGTGRPPT